MRPRANNRIGFCRILTKLSPNKDFQSFFNVVLNLSKIARTELLMVTCSYVRTFIGSFKSFDRVTASFLPFRCHHVSGRPPATAY